MLNSGLLTAVCLAHISKANLPYNPQYMRKHINYRIWQGSQEFIKTNAI